MLECDYLIKVLYKEVEFNEKNPAIAQIRKEVFEMTHTTLMVKEENEKLLRRIFYDVGTATKPELAAKSGLSVVTVNSLVKDMVLHGEVREQGQVPSDGGRPSMRYAYQFERKQAVICYAHYNRPGQNIRVCTYATDLSGKKRWELEHEVEEITVETFRHSLDAAFSVNDNVRCLYFGLPGELVGDIITINDFENLIGDRFMAFYRQRYQADIYVENDINAISYGNYRSCITNPEESLAGIYIPQRFCPGAGFVLNERIYYGAGHLSGEIGKLSVPFDWHLVDYGNAVQAAANIAEVLRVLCMTLAPHHFVIYGAFMNDEILERIEDLLTEERSLMPGMSIRYARDMVPDYEKGLTALALAAIRED